MAWERALLPAMGVCATDDRRGMGLLAAVALSRMNRGGERAQDLEQDADSHSSSKCVVHSVSLQLRRQCDVQVSRCE